MAKKAENTEVQEPTHLVGKMKTNAGTMIMSKEKGYTAGPTLNESSEVKVVPTPLINNGYVCIQIEATETEASVYLPVPVLWDYQIRRRR